MGQSSVIAETQASVYVVTHRASGKRYAGFTANSIRVRWSQHVADSREGDPRHFPRAIRKYGSEAFTIQEVYRGPKKIALEIERGLIEAQGLRDRRRGYNCTTGGEHWQHSEETKAQIRAKRALQAPASSETRAKLGKAVRRAIAARPPEVEAGRRRKISEARMGRSDERTPEGRARHAAAMRGRKHTPEARAKMSANRMGIRPSAETRSKRSASMKAALARRSPEAEELRRKRQAAAHRGSKMSDEQRRRVAAGTRAALAKRTPEQKAAHYAKIAETKRRKAEALKSA